MAYATLMVHVDFAPAADARIRLAAALAGRFEAALIGIAACALRPPFAAEGVVIDPQLGERDFDELKGRLDRRGQQFRTIAAKGSRHVEWRSALDFPTDVVAREARAADLVIIGRERASGDIYQALDPGALLLAAGRPVLAVPRGVDNLKAERVAIAWKDTREARRALADALPFLRDAEKVLVVEICDEGEQDAAQRRVADVMQYLTRHRITTSAGIMLHAGKASDELLRVIHDEGIDLLVAGAYGRTRLGEWVFGGVTHDLLAASPICCLLSH